MARLAEKDYTYFRTVRGMCRQCRRVVPARVFFRNGQVWQESLCPDCRNEPALIASDQDWYMTNILRAMPDHSPLPHAKPSQKGCPYDCGPCTWHATPCHLPVISITNDCNLRCPICFTYNRSDQKFYKSVDEMQQTINWVVDSSGPLDLVNITGGEPTLHPNLIDILHACKRPEIGRITLNSNGIVLAEDIELCQQLADLEICVVLSFNTFDGRESENLNGMNLVETKLKAIDNLTQSGVRITLLNVMICDHNEDAISGILELMKNNDNILSLVIQTMTYSGQGGSTFEKCGHIPVDKAAKIVCGQSENTIEFDDFVTCPSVHPLCYLVCYMLKINNKFLPLTKLAAAEQIQNLIHDSYLIRPGQEDFFTDTINNLYANGKTEHLDSFRNMVEQLYPKDRNLTDFERHRVGESFIKTIYIHAHMDEDTFDCSRAMLCPDLVPSEPGRLIPACTYNLFYRMQDERFYINGNR